MALKAETSIMVGLATAAVVYGVYQLHMPPTAAVRASEANNQHVDASRKAATWIAAGAVGAISLVAHDPTVFVLGGAMVIALDFSNRHANAVDNVSGKIPATGLPADISH